MAQEQPTLLRLAVEPESLSYSQQDSQLQRLRQVLAAEHIRVEPYSCPWARCLRDAASGKVDLLEGLYRSPAREKFLIFLEPPKYYQQAEFRFFSLADSNVSITRLANLPRYRFASLRGALYFEEFDNNPDILKVSTPSETALVKLVLKGRVDALIAHTSLTKPLIDALGGETLYQQPLIFRQQKPIYYAVPKTSQWAERYHRLSTLLQQSQGEIGKANMG